MNDEHQIEERIEAYVMNRMSDDDRKVFELEMENDAQLTEAVEMHRLIYSSLGDEKRNALRSKVSQVIRDNQKQAPSIRRIDRRQYIWLAAAVVISLIGFFAWFLIEPKVQPQQLFAEYFEPYPVYQVSRSEDNNPQFQEAMELYGLERYSESGEILKALDPELTTQKQAARFYYAMTLLTDDNDSEAEEVLLPLSRTEGSYQQQAKWYLALSYLKNENIPGALQLLESLKDEPGRFGKLSTDLLNDLN